MPPKKKDAKAEEPLYVDEEGAYVHEDISARYSGGVRRYTVQTEQTNNKKNAPGTPPPDAAAASSAPAVLYRHGHGTFSSPSFEYTGEWVNDVMHGKGKLTFVHTGASYEGELVQGHYEGQGTYRWADGSQYTGSWRCGRMHGEGVFTEPNDGPVWKGTYYNGTGPGLERLYRAKLNTFSDL